MKCRNCGRENKPENVFCEFCGFVMEAGTETVGEVVTDDDMYDPYIYPDEMSHSKLPGKLKIIIPSAALGVILILAALFVLVPSIGGSDDLSSKNGSDAGYEDTMHDDDEFTDVNGEEECIFSYNQDGYSDVKVKYGEELTISSKEPDKKGQDFNGWNIKRNDGMYRGKNEEWVDSKSEAETYYPGDDIEVTAAWADENEEVTDFELIADWNNEGNEDGKAEEDKEKQKESSKETSSSPSSDKKPAGTTPSETKGNYDEPFAEKIVSEAEYNSKYRNNSKYKCTKLYRYATRSKETTTSGYDSLSGYTKYDSNTSTTYSDYKFGTPISSSTSYSGGKKVTKSASDAGYYYYAYAAGNPSKSSDWSFFCAKSRSTVISHMKQNYSASYAWSENNLRYFWFISTSDLGSNPSGSKISRSIPYCSNSTVGVGSFSKSGTHYYDIPMYKYNRCYKVKTVTRINYFYRWSQWSSWSDWTPNPPSAGDTVKIDDNVKYSVEMR